jgi:hypothetical protein
MSRTPWPAAVVFVLLVSATAHAQIAQPDGWVGEGGRIVRPGDATPGGTPRPAAAIRPATRADWIGECEQRLAFANRLPDPARGYEGVCRAWLDYYERTGATAQGYGFTYAIPVSITTFEVPGNCPPPAVVPPPRPPVRHHAAPDKRVKLIRY